MQKCVAISVGRLFCDILTAFSQWHIPVMSAFSTKKSQLRSESNFKDQHWAYELTRVLVKSSQIFVLFLFILIV